MIMDWAFLVAALCFYFGGIAGMGVCFDRLELWAAGGFVVAWLEALAGTAGIGLWATMQLSAAFGW